MDTAWIVAIVAIAGGWLVAVALVWTNQERVVFRPPRIGAPAATHHRRVTYASSDGTDLFAYVVGDGARGKRPVVIAIHGNADLARWYLEWADAFATRAGVTVVVPEYRGYDGVAGPPSCEGARRDVRAALDWARGSLASEATPIVYYGHSLGAALAADLAADVPPAVLVLESPFTSARAMARRLLIPGLTVFWGLLSRVSYDNVARVRALDVPVWVAHGDRDLLIPVSMGRAVFEAARRRGALLIVPGAGHNNVDDLGGHAYWEWLTAAVRSAAGQSSTVSPRDGVPTS